MNEADKQGFFAEFIHGAVALRDAGGRPGAMLISWRTSP